MSPYCSIGKSWSFLEQVLLFYIRGGSSEESDILAMNLYFLVMDEQKNNAAIKVAKLLAFPHRLTIICCFRPRNRELSRSRKLPPLTK